MSWRIHRSRKRSKQWLVIKWLVDIFNLYNLNCFAHGILALYMQLLLWWAVIKTHLLKHHIYSQNEGPIHIIQLQHMGERDYQSKRQCNLPNLSDLKPENNNEWYDRKTAADNSIQQQINRMTVHSLHIKLSVWFAMNHVKLVSYFLFYICRGTLHKSNLLQVKSVFSQSWKVVPWCKALTSSVSRQRRSRRRRKQSSACFCFTSSDMAWPLHRSLLCTVGILVKCRLGMCVCSYVCAFLTAYFVLSPVLSGKVSKVFSREVL